MPRDDRLAEVRSIVVDVHDLDLEQTRAAELRLAAIVRRDVDAVLLADLDVERDAREDDAGARRRDLEVRLDVARVGDLVEELAVQTRVGVGGVQLRHVRVPAQACRSQTHTYTSDVTFVKMVVLARRERCALIYRSNIKWIMN